MFRHHPFWPLTVIAVLSLNCAEAAPPAKPMLAPKIEDACATYSFVEAEFLSFEADPRFEKIGYFDGPIAKYRVTKLLSGKPVPSEFEIYYMLNDDTSCIEPEGWKFDPTIMPSKGSRWLLVVAPSDDGRFQTFRGMFGRRELTDATYKAFKPCLKDQLTR